MHELSITQSIVAMVSERAEGRRVSRVSVEIGELSAIVPDAVRFCFELCCKVTILSVTEGENKPIKYPHMFRASSVMVPNKMDLVPYLSFDVNRCLGYARQVNPDIRIFQVSATTGEGMGEWYTWLESH